MSPIVAYSLLLGAALLEAAGDALARMGLHASGSTSRVGLFLGAAAVLLAYGVLVNSPPWDFGKLLGIYVTLFFVVAQVVNLLFFHVWPAPSVYVGGALIVAGGLLITLWQA
jgi:hypothetical protein